MIKSFQFFSPLFGRALLLLTLFFTSVKYASTQCCVGTNLCTNPSFETDDHVPSNFNTTFQGTPAAHNAAGWSYGESISFPAAWDYMDGNGYYLNGGDAQDGTRFVYTRGDGQCVNYAFNKSNVCKVYQACFYAAAFSPSGAQGSADFGIHFRAFSGINLGGSQVGAEPVIEFTAPASTSWANLNWQQYTVTIMVPASASSLVIHFSSAEGTDGICFDNVCITDITSSNAFASNSNPACGGALTLYGLTQGQYTWPGTPQITYSWTGPNGFASTQQNPLVTNSASATQNGTYTLVVTAGPTGNTCQYTATTTVAVSCVSCALSSAGKTLETCNNNSTSANVADDYITFSLNPTGTGLGGSYSVSVNNGGTLTNLTNGLLTGISYGSAMSFRLQNGSANGTLYTITVTDASGAPCTVTTTVQQSACSTPCALGSAGKTLEACNDNGTSANSTDDYISFSLNPTGTGLGGSYSVSVNNGGTLTNLTNGLLTGISYGSAMSFRLQNGSANGTMYTITVTDASGAPCTVTTTVQQSACSTPCALGSAGKTLETCNDNGTSANSTDDYITFSLNPTGTGLGGSYSVSVNNGGTLTNLTNGLLTGISYGSAMSFRLQNGSGTGTLYTITVTDASGAPCTITTTVQQTCTLSGSCNCKEYIYMNEPALGTVLKLEVNAPVLLNEVTGANGSPHWYPGAGSSQLSSPHGLGYDLNGNLYIGSNVAPSNPIRQFSCDGSIRPVSGATISDNAYELYNIFSIGNTLYKNGSQSIRAFNSCTGAFIGAKCLNGTNSTYFWGLSYNSNTQMAYATSDGSSPGDGIVWSMTKAQLEDFSTCASPLISRGASSSINLGENYIPSGITILGITSDNYGNIYIAGFLTSPPSLSQDGVVLKYNASGGFIARTSIRPEMLRSFGIVWSETTDRLYITNLNYDNISTVDCISALDTDLNYLGAAAPNPNTPNLTFAKAISIMKECCPVNLASSFTRDVCGLPGQKFYLNQEAFNTCGGVVCGSSWTPTSLSGMTFDPCDNSVTITGTGCGVFTLNIGAVSSTGCGAQSSTFTICNTVPPVISNASPVTQNLCEGNTGANMTVQTDQNATNNIRFVRFTSDQMAGATPTEAEAGVIYMGGTTISIVTPTGGSAPYVATLTAAEAGWNNLVPGTYYIYAVYNSASGAMCIPVPVQEFVVTITDLPVLTTSSASICAGSTIDLSTLVTGNTPAGTLSFHTSLAAANAGTSPLASTVAAPAATTTYYVRSQMTGACYTVATITVTVNNAPTFSVINGSVCAGSSIDLATLVTNTGGGTLSYHTSLAAAQTGTPALGSSTVSPASATHYYVRSTTSGCYTVQRLTVLMQPSTCGVIQVTGPNNN